MNENLERIRSAFRSPVHLSVKVTPEGFDVDGHLFPELIGRIVKVSLLRKRFQDGVLACTSPDGLRSTDGTLCDSCCHPECQPRLRAQLLCGQIVYTLELAASSARNLLATQEQAERQGSHLWLWPLRLTVESRGYWGQVRFQKEQEHPEQQLNAPST
jgi:hypothetical protein